MQWWGREVRLAGVVVLVVAGLFVLTRCSARHPASLAPLLLTQSRAETEAALRVLGRLAARLSPSDDELRCSVEAAASVRSTRGRAIYLNNGLEWEHDFVLHLLGAENAGALRHFIFPKSREYPSSANYTVASVAATPPDWEILVWSATSPWTLDFCVALARANPNRRVLVMLSYEYVRLPADAAAADAHRRHWKPLFDLFSVVVRAYATGGSFAVTKPVFQMPLGYMRGMFESLPVHRALLPASQRPFVWAFVGNDVKEDRRQMVEGFRQLGERGPYAGPRVPGSLRAAYDRAVFVPIGHGNVCTEVMRTYEASACGAIPVLVEGRASRDFHHGRVGRWEDEGVHELPWIFLDRWEDAAAVLLPLLQNKTALLERQLAVVAEWERSVRRTQAAVLC